MKYFASTKCVILIDMGKLNQIQMPFFIADAGIIHIHLSPLTPQ